MRVIEGLAALDETDLVALHGDAIESRSEAFDLASLVLKHSISFTPM